MFDLIPMYFAHTSAIVFVLATFVLMTMLIGSFLDFLAVEWEIWKEKTRLPSLEESEKVDCLVSKYPNAFPDRKSALLALRAHRHANSDLDDLEHACYLREQQVKSAYFRTKYPDVLVTDRDVSIATELYISRYAKRVRNGEWTEAQAEAQVISEVWEDRRIGSPDLPVHPPGQAEEKLNG